MIETADRFSFEERRSLKQLAYDIELCLQKADRLKLAMTGIHLNNALESIKTRQP